MRTLKKSRTLTLLSIILFLLAAGCGQPSQTPDFDRIGLEEITIDELRTGYDNGDFTVQEVVQAYLERIESIDRHEKHDRNERHERLSPSLNAVRTVNPHAMETAAVLDRELQEGIIRAYAYEQATNHRILPAFK